MVTARLNRSPLARRLRRLPRTRVCGVEVPVAATYGARLLGLAGLSRERCGAGLLLPDCRAVHTVGMRFPLELVFLDSAGAEVRRVRAVEPGRFVAARGAEAVLELPSGPAVGRSR